MSYFILFSRINKKRRNLRPSACGDRLGGEILIYLDHAATGGSKAPSVSSAVLAAMRCCANPGRSGHTLSLAAAERVFACRKCLSDLFDGYGIERVVFTKNCTEALNFSILGTLKQGDHVVTTCLEHNSVLRPLEALKRAGVITYDVAPLKNGRLLPETLAGLVKPTTRMAAVTSASNVTGETPPLAEIKKALPEDVLFVVDGAQGAGHIALPMRKLGIDALALAGHKGMGGIQGSGALLFSERMEISPLLFGGTGSESFDLGMPAFYPDRLESGTLSYPAVCSLYEGALLVKSRREEWARKLEKTTAFFLEGLSELKGYTAYSSPNACGICSFRHARLSSETIAGELSERYGICVRGGLHCAPLIHRALGDFPDGLVRASFSPEQGKKEAKALLSALKEIARHA